MRFWDKRDLLLRCEEEAAVEVAVKRVEVLSSWRLALLMGQRGTGKVDITTCDTT
jgi:hypothetical protein